MSDRCRIANPCLKIPMKPSDSQDPDSRSDFSGNWRWVALLFITCVLVILLALLSKTIYEKQPGTSGFTVSKALDTATSPSSVGHSRQTRRVSSPDAPAGTAEEIVAGKLSQFARGRRDLVYALAKRFKVEVPDDVKRFFEAVEGGRWEEIDAAHNALLAGRDLNTPRSAEVHSIWRAIQETWGSAREAHDWPAQRLLDYGNSVLGALRPGMIYVGGTDPGCFIPTFLNETAEGEHHIVLTQNALADGSYLDYLNVLYGDRLATLTHDDSQRAFDEYVADARKRLEHDQQFPNEPKQIRPGEDISITDNKVQVSGQIAVMSINEKLFQTLMEKNPDASFAMEQSFPFTSTYANATPLGPIMELRVQDERNALSPERAAQSVDYWRGVAQELLSDSESANSANARLAYAKMASDQAALLLNRNYSAEAEQALRLATEIGPSSPEAVFRYVNLLIGQNRIATGLSVAEAAAKAAPDNTQFQDLVAQLKAKKN